jgi:hypothetical protein
LSFTVFSRHPFGAGLVKTGKLRFSPGALNLILPKTIRLEDYTEKGSTNHYENCHGQIPGDSLIGTDKVGQCPPFCLA